MTKLSKMSVSVIMPTLNEGGHIQDLICKTAEALLEAGVLNYEIVVVDDDSADLTWQKAANAPCVDTAHVKVIRRMKDHGLTVSIREGITYSHSDVVVWMDCDFSHPPEKIPQMLYMIGEGYDVAVNSRYVIGGGEDRAGKGGGVQLFLSRLLNWTVRFTLIPSYADYTSGFIALRREVVEAIGLRGDYGEYFVDFIYRAMRSGYKICELPYTAMPRRSGESKTGQNLGQFLRRGWKYYWTVLKLHSPSINYDKKK
jgi:dolichol-phosphate mannosyltransferase